MILDINLINNTSTYKDYSLIKYLMKDVGPNLKCSSRFSYKTVQYQYNLINSNY